MMSFLSLGAFTGLYCLAETLWLRSSQRKLAGDAARLVEEGVVCWPLINRVLPLEKPIRMLGEGRGVLFWRTE
ncbi:MAG: hypothetical protein JNJ83_10775 [Verrucomicrobiaceae bacterium]|nr:hypothetical protein [Verrucomicrobiaceae bacterium]